MESNVLEAKYGGLTDKITLALLGNVFYPDSVSQLVEEWNSIEFRGFKFNLRGESAKIVLPTGFYQPNTYDTGLLSDMINGLVVTTRGCQNELPKDITQIYNVNLKLWKGDEKPYLIGFDLKPLR